MRSPISSASLIEWARQMGEGSSYTDNLPLQCLHPVGHWYEVPNLLRNGVLARLLSERPAMKYLLLHNIDTLGADVDPGDSIAPAVGGPIAADIATRVVSRASGGSIVRLTLGGTHTVEALPAILDGLVASGLRVVPLAELLGVAAP